MNTVSAHPTGPAPARAPELDAVVDFFEHLSPADMARIGERYTADAYFKDPFNEVRGSAAIAGIFSHMFVQVHEPRFSVHACVGDAREAFLTWDFDFRRGGDAGTPLRIHGASHLRLDDAGRITWHRDYWDAAEELYEKLPVLGALMRWLKRQVAS